MSTMETFVRLESEVRLYSRHLPVVFSRALNDRRFDESGREYIDFFGGSGALNYGHNNPRLKKPLIAYMQSNAMPPLTIEDANLERDLQILADSLEEVIGKAQPYVPTELNARAMAGHLEERV